MRLTEENACGFERINFDSLAVKERNSDIHLILNRCSLGVFIFGEEHGILTCMPVRLNLTFYSWEVLEIRFLSSVRLKRVVGVRK